MRRDILKAIKTVRERLGPLGWHSLVLFLFLRIGDVANIAFRVLLGRYHMEGLDFGAYDPVIAVFAIVSLPAAVVFQAGARSISRLREFGDHDKVVGLVRDLAKVALVGTAVSFLAVYFLRDYVLERLHIESPHYLLIVAMMCVLAWWNPLSRGVLQGRQNFILSSAPSILTPFVILGLLLLFVRKAGMGLDGALLAYTGGNLLALAVVFCCVKDAFAGRRSRYPEEWKKIRAMLLPMAVFMGGNVLLGQFDRLFVRNFMVNDSAGYAAVITLGQVPLRLIEPLIFVVFPLAAAEHAGGRDVNRFCRQVILIGAAITALGTVGFVFGAGPLMRLWNAQAFVPYAGLVWVFALGMGFEGIAMAVAQVNFARHHYSFLWFTAIPTVLLCSGLYVCWTVLDIEFTLATVVIAGMVTRLAIMLGVVGSALCRSKITAANLLRQGYAGQERHKKGIEQKEAKDTKD